MRRYLAKILAVIVCAVLLSGGLTYYTLQSQEYGTIGDYVVTKDEVHKIFEMLSEYQQGNSEFAKNKIGDGIYSLQEYYEILSQMEEGHLVLYYLGRKYSKEKAEEILSKYSYSRAQALSMIKILSIILDRVNYVDSYDTYISDVHKNVKNMLEVKLFTDGTRSSIVKTEKDFYGLENVELTPSLDVGVDKLMGNHISNVIGILCGMLCAYFFTQLCRTEAANGSVRSNGLGYFSLLIAAGAAGIFIAEVWAADAAWELGDLARSVQSVISFKTSPYLLTMGMLLGLRVLFKCSAVVMIFLVCAGMLFLYHRKDRNKIWIPVFVVVLAGMEILLDRMGAAFTVCGLFHTEHIWGRYRNIIIFGWPVSTGFVLILITILLLLTAALFAEKQQRATLLELREGAEQQYFREVDKKYTETRMLRHDISNHLSAMAILLKEKKVEDAERYLQQVMDYFDTTKPPVRTGVNVLDAVLLGKINLAREKGISVELDFQQGFSTCNLPDFELCSIFSNLLDNAISACEKLEKQERRIRLKVTNQMEMICIFCENPYESLQKENGRFLTQKADRRNHGMGIRQIERIAGAHNGTVEINTQGRMFSVSVLLGDAHR